MEQHIVKYSSLEQATQFGITYQQITHACEQVSAMIDEYNYESEQRHISETGEKPETNEMLPKRPEELYHQLLSGNSCYIVAVQPSGDVQVRHHSAIYDLIESEDVVRRIGIQVFECGSAITHKDFRGKGFGKEGARYRLELMQNYHERTGIPAVGITTLKRFITEKTWRGVGAQRVDFASVPYTVSLTCSCSQVSERYHDRPCTFRRQPESSIPELLPVWKSLIEDAQVDLNRTAPLLPVILLQHAVGNPEQPCTLLCTDPRLLYAFEKRCDTLFRRAVAKGDIAPSQQTLQYGSIDRGLFQQADLLFSYLRRL